MIKKGLATTLFVCSLSSLAGNGECGYIGGLSFIGRTSDNANSIWLVHNKYQRDRDVRLASRDASYTNDFSMTPQSFKIKVSTKVATTSDGDHIFSYPSAGDCPIDTKSQVGGIVIPVTPGGGGDGGGDLGDIVIASQEGLMVTSHFHNRSISTRVLQNYLGRNEIDSDSVLGTKDHGLKLWADTRFLNSSDRDGRYGRKTEQNSLLVGADTELTNEIYAGVALSLEKMNDDAFGGSSIAKSNGWNIGPYASLLFWDKWFADAWIGFGSSEIESKLDWLNGEFDSKRLFLSTNLTTQTYWGPVTLLPKASLYYAHFMNDAYTYSGTDSETSKSAYIDIAEKSYNYSSVTISNEFNYLFEALPTFNIEPYINAAVVYDIYRPLDNSSILEGTSVEEPSRFTGELYAGARFFAFKSVELEASIGYASFFQKSSDIWSYHLSADFFVF